MPALGTHFRVMDEVLDSLFKKGDKKSRRLAELLRVNSSFTALGAVGPDLFYFVGKDPQYAALLAKILSFLKQLTGVFEEAGKLTGSLPAAQAQIEQIAKRVQQLATMFSTVVIKDVVDFHNLVTREDLIPLPAMQTGKPESEWKWGDLMHDRVSGAFAQRLLSRAIDGNNDRWLAYAYGYYSHIATDFVGHPYVNHVVGGPARSHPMRHALAEKFIDAWVYQSIGSDINNSELQRKIEDIKQTSQLDDLAGMMSQEIAELIKKQAFGPSVYSGPDPDEIAEAVNSLYELLKLLTDSNSVEPPDPPSFSIPPPPNFPSAPAVAGSAAGGSLNPETLAEVLAMTLKFGFDLGNYLGSLALWLLDVALTPGLYAANVALYLLQLAIYPLYRAFRWYLVLATAVYPMFDEIQSLVGMQFWTLLNYEGYPRKSQGSLASHLEQQKYGQVLVEVVAGNWRYLVYPAFTGLETPGTLANPYPSFKSPSYFIRGSSPDIAEVNKWNNIQNPADMVQFARDLRKYKSMGFGSAVELTLHLFEDPFLAERFNLDADRGYAYRQWSGVTSSGDISGEKFL